MRARHRISRVIWTGIVAAALPLVLASPAFAVPGALDTTFSGDGKQTTKFGTGIERADAIAVQSDGKIVVAGKAKMGSTFDFAVARYNANGTLDTSFSNDGKVTTSFGTSDDVAYDVAIQPDGKIVVAGSGGNYQDQLALARYTTTGALDATFDGDGKVLTGSPQVPCDTEGIHGGAALALRGDGVIVVAAVCYESDLGGPIIIFYGGNGTIRSFSLREDWCGGEAYHSLASWRVEDLALQADGKVVLAVTCTWTGNLWLWRYAPTSGQWHTNSWDFGKQTDAFGVAIQPDGKILVVGRIGPSYQGPFDFLLVRWNSNLTLDTTFSGDGKQTTRFSAENDEARAVVVQPDGKILAGGFARVGTTTSNLDFALARYKANGALDTTFSVDGKQTTSFGTGGDLAYAIARQGDGKIVLAGQASISGNLDFALARYLAA